MRCQPWIGLLFICCWVLAATACERDGEATGEARAQSLGPPMVLPDSAGLPEGQRRLIDAHSHLFGESWGDIAPIMASERIDYFVNLSGGSPRRGMGSSMALAAASGGRILNAMNVDWRGVSEPAFGEVVAAELALCVTRYGYVGLKISKALGLGVEDVDGSLLAVDDPRLFPIWERAGELGVPVFIHTGDPAAFWLPITPANERYEELLAHPSWSFADPSYPTRAELLAQRDRLVSRFPETIFVAVHFGNNPEDLDYVDRFLTEHPNAYVDLAARLGEIGRHDPARVREVFVRHQDRIVFATDIAAGRRLTGELVLVLGSSGTEEAQPSEVSEFYRRHYAFLETDAENIPHPTPIQGRWTIDAVGLPDDVLRKIYYDNAFSLIVAPHLARLEQR